MDHCRKKSTIRMIQTMLLSMDTFEVYFSENCVALFCLMLAVVELICIVVAMY